ncbi:TlpA family protein disulfide reductase [Microbacterium excoecariae]|uniref:TlpA family protein disulfide reductase n=1 Tax=Microbacterium excoecariae TaxID=2715210 RepID=UPI00140C1BEB|nr:thioredoxin family protein [Microbacterium excoecariae]
MSPLLAAALVIGVLAVAALAGAWIRRRDGRARATDARAVTPDMLAADPGSFGDRATLVQFSTEMCARCPGTRRLLGQLASETDGVGYVDVDLTHRTDIARAFDVLQTPTVLVLDAAGVQRTRIGGAPRREDVLAALAAAGEPARV